MAGGFSYPLSQLNRVTQSRRQPGSSFKPMTYLAALNNGLQPNTLVEDAPITYPPIGGATRYTRADGLLVAAQLRRRLLRHDDAAPRAGAFEEPGDGAAARRRHRRRRRAKASTRSASSPIEAQRLSEMRCATIRSCSAPSRCGRSTSPAFYAAIANEGKRPTPHVIEQITQDGREVYKADEDAEAAAGVDPAAVFQLRTLLQGVVARGTAARLSALSPYIGGKTGTSDDFNDAWFAGFSNDVTVVVWVGYDNAKGKRTLGHGQAGSQGRDADLRADHAGGLGELSRRRRRCPGPSPEAARHLVALPIDLQFRRSGSTAAAAMPASMSAAPAAAASSAAGSWNISGSTTAAASTTRRIV